MTLRKTETDAGATAAIRHATVENSLKSHELSNAITAVPIVRTLPGIKRSKNTFRDSI